MSLKKYNSINFYKIISGYVCWVWIGRRADTGNLLSADIITKNIKPGDMCHYQKPEIFQEYNITATDASGVPPHATYNTTQSEMEVDLRKFRLIPYNTTQAGIGGNL